uniref:VWFC domain-containing protein n=1 Tax=Anopheles farauti TaxID=69004 RepID=A0A182Q345_9DIPT
MITRVYMMTPMLHFSSVTVLLVLAATVTMCVPTHFTDPEQHFRNSIDLDAEQTEARYDQEMLSDIIKDNDRGELQKAESCLVDDYKYDHGQKIQRLDPCEICLCIDGEIFCWWKQCDSQAKSAQEPDQSEHSLQHALNNEQSASEPFSESSIITSTSNAASVSTAKSRTTFEGTATENSNSGNGATKLTLSDSLSDGGTTVISSTLPISTPSSRGQDPDHGSSETVTHHGTVHTQDTIEGIPKNILSFPQTPPIMMYRPVSTGPIGSSSPREGKYGDGGRKAKAGTMVGTRKMKSGTMGSHKKSKDHKKKPEKGSSDGRYSFDFERKPTVSIASDALPKVADADSSREGDRLRDRGAEDFENHSGQTIQEEQERSMSEQQQFGGYGYGMIHEPEPEHRQATPPMRGRDRDVPQHYIITSSGHVEMFDDSGTLGVSDLGVDSPNSHATDTDEFAKPQYRDVLSFDGRVSSRVVQDQHSNGSTGEDSDATDSDEDDEVEEMDEQPKSETGGPVAPAIMLTTNVTQGKYSLGGGGEMPASTQLPASQASIIDILNSTTLETDYVDGTNHSELIYPEVPAISSSSSSSTTTRSPTKLDQSNQHCVVMGVTYPVGAVLKQETGNCLQCVCVAGPENDPAPRVTCTPLNCPPLILPDILDGAGF